MASWMSWRGHLDDEQLVLYLDRELKLRSRLRTGVHLLFCLSCRNALRGILLQLEEIAPVSSSSPETLRRIKLGLIRAMRGYELRGVRLSANAASQVSQIVGGLLASILTNNLGQGEDSLG